MLYKKINRSDLIISDPDQGVLVNVKLDYRMDTFRFSADIEIKQDVEIVHVMPVRDKNQ